MKRSLFLSITALLLVACQNNEPKTSPDTDESTAAPQKPLRSNSDSLSVLIEQDGDNALLYAQRANYLLTRNQMQKALDDINRALALDSNLAEAYHARGEYHFAVNKSRQAKEDWQRCLKLEPNNSNCLSKLAELMIAVQDYEKALELVNRQLDVNSKDPQAYFMKGIILRDRYKDTATALQYFQNAIDLKQDYLQAIDMMGTLLLQKGDTLARYYFERILEMDPNRDDVYHKLGIFYMNNDQPNRALENYTKALQINPRNADALYNLGYMHITWRQYQKAREYFSQAIAVGEEDYKSYFGRGLAYEMPGDILNARKDYRKALEELPVFKPAQEALGRVNAMIKDEQQKQQ